MVHQPAVNPEAGSSRARVASQQVSRSSALRFATLVVLFLAIGVLAAFGPAPSVSGLRASIADVGPLAPAVFVAVYAIATSVLLPASPFTVAAGVLFGPTLGVATALLGAVGGAVIGFGVGRVLGRDTVRVRSGERLERLEAILADRGVLAVVLVRLVPIFPLNVVNVLGGVTALRLRDHALGTALGIVPATVAYAVVGGTADRPGSMAFLAASTLLVVVLASTWWAALRLQRRHAISPSRTHR
jgi:uncharacterized membrane protein YdjX (TVP38/TMEM64 family)